MVRNATRGRRGGGGVGYKPLVKLDQLTCILIVTFDIIYFSTEFIVFVNDTNDNIIRPSKLKIQFSPGWY